MSIPAIVIGALLLMEGAVVPAFAGSAPAQPSGNTTVEWVKAVAPVGAALIAVVGVALTAYFTLRRGILDARYQYAAEMLKFRLRQIQEFYAPAMLLIEQSALVYEKLKWVIARELPGLDLDGFRLLDHMADFQKNDKLKPLVYSIMQIGNRLTKLISEKSGLIEGGLTPIFIEYEAHFTILRAASQYGHTGAKQEGWQEFGYYPRLLNREIREGYKVVLAYLDNYANAGDEIIRRLLRQKTVVIGQHRRRLIQNLRFYEDNVKKYAARFDAFDLSLVRQQFTDAIENTRNTRPKNLLDNMIRLLDAGCGTGRDAYEFIRKGYVVTAVDASPAMLRECRRKLRDAKDKPESAEMRHAATESRVFEQTFDEITFRNEFDGVWAAAALLHVPSEQMEESVKRLVQTLKPGGILFMSFKYGRGEHEYDARFYTYYGRRDIRALVQRIPCAEEICIWLSDIQGKDLPSCRQRRAWVFEYMNRYDRSLWLNVMLKRRYV